MNWYQMESQEVMDKLNRFQRPGLIPKRSYQTPETLWKNELQSEKGPDFFRQVAAQFKDFMILTLLAAAGISFFASYAQGEMNLTDPLIILAIVILNALLGNLSGEKGRTFACSPSFSANATMSGTKRWKTPDISSPELVPGD